jgi:hypothetical protein
MVVKVGQYAAYPPLVDEIHVAALGFFFDNGLGLFFGANKQDFSTIGNQLFNVFASLVQQLRRLFKVYNVNFVSLGKDVALHFGVPAAGLVAEVCPCFQ